MTNVSISIELTDGPIDSARLWMLLDDVDAGAHNMFLGKTRRRTGDQVTDYLVYEAYPDMAKNELRRLAKQAAQRWSVRHIAIIHRLGRIELGEASVGIGVSAAHRTDVFDVTAWLLEELKKHVPIWKQEHWLGGETQWVHP